MTRPDFSRLNHEIEHIFKDEDPGHDYLHLCRVVNNARAIWEKAGGDWSLIEAGCWCHDLGDQKLGHELGPVEYTQKVLQDCGADEVFIERTVAIVSSVSFKGGQNKEVPTTIEAKIVQDADRLDAIGAIGIARCFAFSGKKGTRLFHPDERPKTYNSDAAYRSSNSSAVMHFYEKLFLLKDRMQTTAGKQMAEDRHVFMETYLQQFFAEWGEM